MLDQLFEMQQDSPIDDAAALLVKWIGPPTQETIR
jgi:hypothetical protein